MTRTHAVAALLAVFVLSACSDVLPPDGGSGDFDISVSTGSQPTYTWSGGPARDLRVMAVENPLTPVWAVASTNPTGSTIVSPFRHGTVPAQTQELENQERTLTPGRRYRVEITLLNQQRASHDFRP